ncbi:MULTISPECIES: polysaccharide pyruvyl transferase family protein [unclassified Endozoicomonas]|uniref:polysaccharide pyruvyl transferase family protein n=1 Tax=unclassified Endozoicomonas TaxID=2644528 RepID=UPI003BB5EDB0
MNIKAVYNHFYNSLFESNLTLKKPRVIQFPVIDICNSRCQMCRIWENKQSRDITSDELRKGFESDLFSNVEGIGFNGGEPTLRKDLIQLVEIALEKLPKLQYVSIITNAFKHRQVIEQLENLGKLVKSFDRNFDVMVSLDGFGDIHDAVRGRSGNFENAKKVLSFLSEFSSVDSVRVGCTVVRENVFELPDLLEFCIHEGFYIKFRLGIPHQRLYTENLLDPYALTFEEKYEFVEFLEGVVKNYETNPMQIFFYRSLIDQILYNKPRAAGCDWKDRGATITAKGELAYCAVKSKALMDNIAEGDPMQAYFGNSKHLKDIINNECDNCHHDYTGLPKPVFYRRILLERLDEKFSLKENIRKLPGFIFLNNIRNRRRFLKQIEYFRTKPETIDIPRETNKKILICGWYGTETLGDKGILGGVINTFSKLLGEPLKFTIVALNPYVTEMTRRQMQELRNVEIVTPEEGVGLVKQMNYVVFGGGPLMALDSLAPMQAIFERAKSHKVCTVVTGCGIGPLGSSWHNNSVASILRLANIRVYRDARSLAYAKQLGIETANDSIAEDPAFTWLTQLNGNLPKKKKNNANKVLLLGLRDFPYKEYARHIPEKEALRIRDNYENVVVDALIDLKLSNPDIIIKPLPMCTNHFGSDDRWFYRRLFRNKTILVESLDYSLLGREMEPTVYCKEFRTADALLAMRFHSLVFGLGLGVNSVALDYTLCKGKVHSLAERFDVHSLSISELNSEELVYALEVALDAPSIDPIDKEDLLFESSLRKKLKEVEL